MILMDLTIRPSTIARLVVTATSLGMTLEQLADWLGMCVHLLPAGKVSLPAPRSREGASLK